MLKNRAKVVIILIALVFFHWRSTDLDKNEEATKTTSPSTNFQNTPLNIDTSRASAKKHHRTPPKAAEQPKPLKIYHYDCSLLDDEKNQKVRWVPYPLNHEDGPKLAKEGMIRGSYTITSVRYKSQSEQVAYYGYVFAALSFFLWLAPIIIKFI